MKEYLVFMGNDFYPIGGWEDFSDQFDSLEEAKKYIKSQDCDDKWAHIVYQQKIIMMASGETEDFRKYYWEFQDYAEFG